MSAVQRRGCTAARRGGSSETPIHCSPTSVAATENRRQRQKTMPRLASQNCRMGQQTSQTSKPARSRASLYKELEHRVEELHLDKNDASSNSRTVEELGEILLSKLTQSYPALFHWDKLNSGSYYDKTKVRLNFSADELSGITLIRFLILAVIQFAVCRPCMISARMSSDMTGCSLQIKTPDEYDCMFTCQIRSERVYHPHSPSRSYAGLRIMSKNWEPSELLLHSSDGDFLCPKAFKARFRQHVKEALQQTQPTGTTVGKLYVT